MQSQKPYNKQLWWRLILIIGLLLAVLFFIMTPWNIEHLPSRPNPAKSYNEALARTEALRLAQAQPMNPRCELQLMTHKHKTEHAIVLVHGYTSCPRQFQALGKQFYNAGYNVLIAPLPHHGYANRLSREHGKLTAEELATYADRTIDIAHGLGNKVVMMGLSAGGVTTAWAAQNRPDIERAIIISPAFGFKQIPLPFTAAAMNLFSALPDEFEWWNPTLREHETPTYAYPQYSRHALTQILRLGFIAKFDALHHAPATKKIALVVNHNDTSVSNEAALQFIAVWQKKQNQTIAIIEFADSLKLPHDLIDPEKVNQRTNVVYPRLLQITGGER
uniref:Serine aminopeptidase S33 domain-containing protein n=1 Tax=Chlorobium chlorochromatii (strain CaD3) TaxID=340177 RepID=Q3ARC7_CHLCH